MKKVFLTLLALVILVSPAVAQQTQPPVLDTPVQYNSINTSANAGGTSNAATVTISGVSGQRVRVYWVAVQCGATNTNQIPTLIVSGSTSGALFNTSGNVITGVTYPVGQYRWLPGLTFPVGDTVTITGNTGGACSSGTLVHVQADQF